MGAMRPMFQRITKDKYRLVIAESDSIEGLAYQLGLSVSSVCRSIHRAEKDPESERSYQVTWVDEDELETWADIGGCRLPWRISETGKIQYFYKNKWRAARPVIRKGQPARVRMVRPDGSRPAVSVNRLMAEAFMGGLGPGEMVVHLDGTQTNWALDNLQKVDRLGYSMESYRANRRAVAKINTKGEIVNVWESIVAASKATGIGETAIGDRCRHVIRDEYSSRGETFRFADEVIDCAKT